MNTLWFVLGAAVIAAIAIFISSLRRGDGEADMGAVSHQWIAEHRLGPGSDLRR